MRSPYERSDVRDCQRSEAIHAATRGKYGLLRRGACHRARIRATRWLLAMTRRQLSLPPRPQFQAFQSGSNADADLALHAQGLQRDRIGGAADQHVAADADAERGAAL